MKLTILLSFRNLFRQKRRNVLLALVIAFAMAVLILASSLGEGMTDTILNKIIVKMIGHMQVEITEKVQREKKIIRDKERITGMIRNNLDGVRDVQEKIMIYCRGLGNGRSSDVFLEGVETNREFFETLHLEEGKFGDFTDPGIENAVFIAKPYVKKLKVKLNDIIRISLRTINGQSQTANLRVVGIIPEEATVFKDISVFIKIPDLKKIMDYREEEAGMLMISFYRTDRLLQQRKKLVSALQPEPAFIVGEAVRNKLSGQATLIPFLTNSLSLSILTDNIKMDTGSVRNTLPQKEDEIPSVLISKPIADQLRLTSGQKLSFSYRDKFGDDYTTNSYRVGGIFIPDRNTGDHTILISEIGFYATWFDHLPYPPEKYPGAFIPGPGSSIYPAIATEWGMYPEYGNDSEKDKVTMELNKSGWRGALLRISTMYEEGEHMLQYAILMRMITLAGIVILFFITQIGVVNALRMTIRERTREIGTMRAIGFQKNRVRDLFVLETLFLTFFASLGGIILSYVLMGILSTVTIRTTSQVLAVFVINSHLYFLLDIPATVLYLIIILIIAGLSAYFPATKAAAMSASDALRHNE